MKNLGNLSPAPGSNKGPKRLGRGIGSGLGKTAGKGHKGQRARKGGGIREGFEGGQTPLYRRIPKTGFTKPNKVIFNEVNIGSLNLFADNELVSPESLKLKGLLHNPRNPIKILGNGTLERKGLKLKVQKISVSARTVVEKLGGSVEETK
jgi:large subunit ribosomal protein L15